MGRQMTGHKGENINVRVPVGTRVLDADTEEFIGEVMAHGEQLLVARGGMHGLGNIHFKSSTNRAPRQSTNGTQVSVARCTWSWCCWRTSACWVCRMRASRV